ncbi:DUF6671 family protein [Thalassotalea maritima]|uniref:DUF6671 family protein n=1 Tax=Thalassotalea maritima TaxID=3242416 RepID=UPI003526FFDD
MPESTTSAKLLAILTKHGKGELVAPILASVGYRVVTESGFDTDSLGTFSGEVERTLSPLDCAKQKARLACELSGVAIGLGSEGSFGKGPFPGMNNWNSELLVLHDATTGIDIVANAEGPVFLPKYVGSDLQALEQTFKQGDKQQAWILSFADTIIKGLTSWQQIIAHLPDDYSSTVMTLQPDLRAMHCPQRQQYIMQAAEQLAERLQANCPQCDKANFWYHQYVKGLECSACGNATELNKAHIRKCQHCDYQQTETTTTELADPYYCQQCNP